MLYWPLCDTKMLCCTGHCVTLKLLFLFISFSCCNFPLTSRNSYCFEPTEDNIPLDTRLLLLLIPLLYLPSSRLYKPPHTFSHEERTEAKCAVEGPHSCVLKDGSTVGCGTMSASASAANKQ